MRGGIINHHLIAYSLGNISAKNYENRLMCVEDIVCNITVVFSETVYIAICPFLRLMSWNYDHSLFASHWRR